MASVPIVVSDVAARVRKHFDDIGLHKVRVDRWTIEPEPSVHDAYVEVGTVYGEVTIRLRDVAQPVQFERIHLESHVVPALERIDRWKAENE